MKYQFVTFPNPNMQTLVFWCIPPEKFILDLLNVEGIVRVINPSFLHREFSITKTVDSDWLDIQTNITTLLKLKDIK